MAFNIFLSGHKRQTEAKTTKIELFRKSNVIKKSQNYYVILVRNIFVLLNKIGDSGIKISY